MDVQALEQSLFPAVAIPKRTSVLPNFKEIATELQAHHHLIESWAVHISEKDTTSLGKCA